MERVRRATLEDASWVACRLRAEDRAECLAGSGLPPETAIPMAVLAHPDETFVGLGNSGNPCIIFGTAPAPHPLLGFVWMLGTDELVSNSLPFLRLCRQGTDKLHDRYQVLFNFSDARNPVHHRWLKWCGFTIINKHERYGHQGLPFYEFVRIKPHV